MRRLGSDMERTYSAQNVTSQALNGRRGTEYIDARLRELRRLQRMRARDRGIVWFIISVLLALAWLGAFWVVFVAAGEAWAESRIGARVVHVQGYAGLTTGEAWGVVGQALARIKADTGAGLALRSFRTRADLQASAESAGLDYQARAKRLEVWLNHFARRRERGVVKLVILPPIVAQNTLWVAGMAVGGCSWRLNWAVAYINATARNVHGLNRLPHSSLALAHEALHLLGASDDNATYPYGVSLMHTGMLAYVDKQMSIPLSNTSYREVKSCIN